MADLSELKISLALSTDAFSRQLVKAEMETQRWKDATVAATSAASESFAQQQLSMARAIEEGIRAQGRQRQAAKEAAEAQKQQKLEMVQAAKESIRAQKELDKALDESAKRSKAFWSGVLGAFSAAGNFITDTLSDIWNIYKETAANMEKTSLGAQRLGISVEDYAGIEYGATQARLPMERLEMALFKLSQKTGKDAKTALSELAEEFVSMKNPGEQAALVGDLLGARLGFRMAAMLRGGKEGLEALKEEAMALRPALNDVNMQKIEAAQQAMRRFDVAVKGLKETLAVALAPFVEYVADLLTQGVKDFHENFKPEDIVDGFKSIALAVADVVDKVTTWAMQLKSVFDRIKAIALIMTKPSLLLFDPVGILRAAYKGLTAPLPGGVTTARDAVEDFFGGLSDFKARQRDKFEDAVTEYRKTPAMLEGSKEAYSTITKFQVQGMTWQDAMQNLGERQVDELKKINEALRATGVAQALELFEF